MSALPASLALLALLAAPAVKAEPVTLDGGRNWGGWDYVANAQTSGVWIKAGDLTRSYNIFSTAFYLDATQTVTGSPLPSGPGQNPGVKADGTTYVGDGTSYTGNTAASLFTGAWQAGDRILGIGIQYTNGNVGTSFNFVRDKGGNDMKPASSFGATDGVWYHGIGDSSTQVMAMWGWENGPSRALAQVDSIWFRPGSGSADDTIRPYNISNPPPGPPVLDMNTAPVRVFNILKAGTKNEFTSVQFLIDLDAILRSNGGESYLQGPVTAADTYAFFEADQRTNYYDIYSMQVFGVGLDVPEPGSLVMLLVGLGALGLFLRRPGGPLTAAA
jgi:hypothetical protein